MKVYIKLIISLAVAVLQTILNIERHSVGFLLQSLLPLLVLLHMARILGKPLSARLTDRMFTDRGVAYLTVIGHIGIILDGYTPFTNKLGNLLHRDLRCLAKLGYGTRTLLAQILQAFLILQIDIFETLAA